MKIVETVRYVFLAFYALLWVGGVQAYVLNGGPPEGLEWTAPLFLAFAALLLVSFAPPAERLVLLLAGLAGFAFEILGVHTGFPFGHYEYTAVLYPKFLGVPFVLAAAWLLLFAYVRQMVRSPWAAALWMTAIDLVIDPLAANSLGFWEWEAGGVYYDVPWTNFAGWFLVSLIIFSAVRRPVTRDPQACWLGLSIVVFFTTIAFGTGLFLAGAVGLILVAFHFVWIRFRASNIAAVSERDAERSVSREHG